MTDTKVKDLLTALQGEKQEADVVIHYRTRNGNIKPLLVCDGILLKKDLVYEVDKHGYGEYVDKVIISAYKFRRPQQ